MDIQTEIIATIGPATLDIDVFQEIVTAGIDCIRINTSYGDRVQYDRILENHKAANKYKDVDIMLDVKQTEALEYAKERSIKTIALSFVENSSRIAEVREAIPGVNVISKIESRVGVVNFEDILAHSDGIMVARGDLGIAVTLPEVPPLQKYFTLKTLEAGKYLITATEMLLSMVERPEPTRAEVSDVANAVFDHSSAVMLSEETAIGNYPVETVLYMKQIIKEAEEWNMNRRIEL